MDGHVVICTNEATLLDEIVYTSWRMRMKGYLKSRGYGIWEKIVTRLIPWKKWSKSTSQREAMKSNLISLEAIFDGISRIIKERIGQCTSAKEIWLKVENLY